MSSCSLLLTAGPFVRYSPLAWLQPRLVETLSAAQALSQHAAPARAAVAVLYNRYLMVDLILQNYNPVQQQQQQQQLC